MTIQHAFIKGNSLISTILLKMSGIGAVQRKFIKHILILILSIRGRINFLQLERYGMMSDRSYRDNFSKSFDWLQFNTLLIECQCSDECIIGFDPSFISKSGKHTPGIGYFYSGCSSKYERGLEIGCYSLLDVKQKTAYHLYAEQTMAMPKGERDKTLMDQYTDQLYDLGARLSDISTVLVADAYFSKRNYVHAVLDQGMEFISRFRRDANLRYLYTGQQKQGKGRKRQYAGKVNTMNLDKRRAKKVFENEGMSVYSIVVNSINLEMNINLVWVENLDKKGDVSNVKMYFSTNLERDALQILEYYKVRFQMEFNFRDGKQFTGLTTCQARSEERLSYHFNAALTSVNIAKAIAREGLAKDQSMPISVSDIKVELSNYLMLQFIFSKFGIDPDLQKNKFSINKILNFGKIAA